VPTRIVLFDTSFVLALENKDDPHHERAKSLDKELLNQGWHHLNNRGATSARYDRQTLQRCAPAVS
jgi:predicted nucleic acid-binding protein